MYNFTRFLDRGADRWPDREVVAYQDKRLTWAQLSDRVNAMAAALLGQGIQTGDVVAILMMNRPEFLETALAVNKIGAIFLPLNYRLAFPELEYILGHAVACGIVTEAEFLSSVDSLPTKVPSLRFSLVAGADQADPRSYEGAIDRHLGSRIATVAVGPDDTQRLMYTSGTTARPKGVALTYANVLWKVFAHIVEFGITSSDRVLMCGPMYHVGAFDLPGMGVLYVGGSGVLIRRFDAATTMETIQAERVTNVWLAPAMLNAVLNLEGVGKYDASSVRFIINGGEKMPTPLIRKVLQIFPNAWLADAYGLTETVSGDTFLDRDHVLSKIGSVGRPVIHLDVRIADDLGGEVGPNQMGEVLLRGPKVFNGYWRDPEATAAAFIDGWFRTGDIGRVDADGFLFIEDRKKDMIVSGGENIATPEIERVLYQHPAVLEAAVIGMHDSRWGEVPKAFVVLKPGQTVTADELINLCRSQLANFKVPKSIVFIADLPRNPSGKVVKRELRTLEHDPT